MKEYIVREPKHIVVGIEEYKTCFGEMIYELIRCKDCKYRDEETANCTRFRKDWYVQSDSFCSRAERRGKDAKRKS